MPTRSGWVAATGVLLCAFAKPCEFVVSPVSPDGGFVLRRLPRLTNTSTGGLVTGLALPNGAVTDFTEDQRDRRQYRLHRQQCQTKAPSW